MGIPFRDLGTGYQTCITMLSMGCLQAVEAAAAKTKIPTGLGNVTSMQRMLNNAKLARDLALILVHDHLLLPKIESLSDMSREYGHMYSPHFADSLRRANDKFRAATASDKFSGHGVTEIPP